MPPKRKAKEKKDLSEQCGTEIENLKNKRNDEAIKKRNKVPVPRTVKQKKQKDETKSARKRKTESKDEEKVCSSSLMRNKVKDDDQGGGDGSDVSERKSRSNKKLKLEPNKDVKTKKNSVDEKARKLKAVIKEEIGSGDGSDYTRHSKRSQSKSEGKNGKRSLKTDEDVSPKRKNTGAGKSLYESDPSSSDFEEVENNHDESRPDDPAPVDKETEDLGNEVGGMSNCDSSDFEDVSSKISTASRKSEVNKTRKGRTGKRKENDDQGEGDESEVHKRKSRSNKKLKLEQNKDVKAKKISGDGKATKSKTVFKEENVSDNASDCTTHSKRVRSKWKSKNGKRSLKTVKDASPEENSGEDAGKSFQESDTDDSDFEEVENKYDENRSDELATVKQVTEDLEIEVEVMSDTDSSEFEEPSPQSSTSSGKSRSKPQSKQHITTKRKSQRGNKKENDDQGEGNESEVSKRKSRSNKKLKMEQNRDVKAKEMKAVIKDEKGSDDASDYTNHSKRAQSKCKGKEEKTSFKNIKDASNKENSGGEAGKSFQESDTDDSDFEEVDNKCEVKKPDELAVGNQGRKELENEVEVMSDSDSSDFEEVASQTTSSSRKSRSTPQSKKQTTKTRKSRTGNKKENDSFTGKRKSVAGSRKRQSKKTAKETVVKKVKTDLNEEIPSTSASVPALYGVDEDDVTAVLLRMEGASCSQPSTSESQDYRLSEIKGSSLSDADSDEDDDGEDWEEVEEHKGSPLKSRIPTEPVEITLEAPDFLKKKRKKKKFDWLAYIQQTMRRFQKNVQIDLHKVHLLCLLSHGFQQNRICNDDLLKAQAISIIPTKWTGLESNFSKENIRQLLKWFHEEFPLSTKSEYFSDSESKHGLVKSVQLENVISSRHIQNGRTLTIILIVILRTLGLDVRLVMSIHPMRFKLTENRKYKVKPKNGESGQVEPDGDKTSKTFPKSGQTKKSEKVTKTGKMKTVKSEEIVCSDDSTEDSEDSKIKNDKIKTSKKEKAGRNGKAKSTSGSKSSKGKQLLRKAKPQSDNESEEDLKPKRNLRTKERKKMVDKNDDDEVSESGFDEFEPSDDDGESDFTDEDYKVKKRRGRQKSGEKPKKGNKQKSEQKQKSDGKKKKPEGKKKSEEETSEDVVRLSSGSEFTEEETSFRSPLQEKFKKKNRKVLSSDSDGSDSSIKSAGDIWTEVFLPGEKRWVCVDCVHNIVDKPYEVEKGITQPVHYVLAYTADGCVSDVTARYASQWMSHTRKLRVDQEWWTETLMPYKSLVPEHGDKDEESIKDQLMKRPLPTSIGEFKNHPLYALPRHLLKFEAIYPETAIPFGYIRKEPIYARECVHTLHSRENWLKEGRAVMLGEEAYKMVKSRKRWRQPVKPDPNVLDLELFGYWQTEKYIPPPAVNGKITRNQYGNIELFKPWMLPGGTVHLQGFPALNRVAKKLGLDCVPAMIDWETHGGFSHPLIDGWIVCEEHKDILIAAWDEDQEIQRQREIEKREKRVLGNWKLLTRSLLIGERLKKKFDLKEAEPEETVDVKGGEKVTDTEQAWPRNRQAEKKKKLPKHVEQM